MHALKPDANPDLASDLPRSQPPARRGSPAAPLADLPVRESRPGQPAALSSPARADRSSLRRGSTGIVRGKAEAFPTSLKTSHRLVFRALGPELARFAPSDSPRSRRACASSQPAGASSKAAGWPDGRPPGPREALPSARATTAPSRRRLHLPARGTSRRTASKSLWMPPSFARLGRGVSARRAECGLGGRG